MSHDLRSFRCGSPTNTYPLSKTQAPRSKSRNHQTLRCFIDHRREQPYDIGDGIPTNRAAARKLYHYFTNVRKEGFQYMQLNFACAAHAVNLVVQNAICGGAMKDPKRDSSICAAVVRFYKYLVPAYHADFVAGVARWLQEAGKVVQAPDEGARAALVAKQQAFKILYGQACPDELTNLFNVAFETPEHTSADPTEESEVQQAFLSAITKHMFHSREHPVITRFWTFAECVERLLSMLIFKIPLTTLLAPGASLAKEQRVRMQRFQKYMESDKAQAELRVACLCLQVMGS